MDQPALESYLLTVQDTLATVETFMAASVARTENVWGPDLRSEYDSGLEHVAQVRRDSGP